MARACTRSLPPSSATAARGTSARSSPSARFSSSRARTLTPADETWLARRSSRRWRQAIGVRAGVYGRQLPHDGRHSARALLPRLPVRRPSRGFSASTTAGEPSFEQTLFSNVNSAIPPWRLGGVPVRRRLIMSEDQEWSRRVLRAGYELVYEPRAAVHHSHAYSVAAAFRRFFDSGASAERSYAAGGERLGRAPPGGRALRARRGRMALGDRPAPLDPLRRRLRAREVHRAAARSPPPAPADVAQAPVQRAPARTGS